MTFDIRRAKGEDAEQIIEAHVRSIREICAKDYPPEHIEAWAGRDFQVERWHKTIETEFVWVVDLDGHIKGFGHLKMHEDKDESENKDIAILAGLYFTNELRGLGAGKKLFQIMKDEAQRQGAKRVRLLSTITAKTFYEACGFVSLGESLIDMNGVKLACIKMQLPLSNRTD